MDFALARPVPHRLLRWVIYSVDLLIDTHTFHNESSHSGVKMGKRMSILPQIIVPDGLDFVRHDRIFSYINGDTHVQAVGFFPLTYFFEVSRYLEAQQLHPDVAQFLQHLRQR